MVYSVPLTTVAAAGAGGGQATMTAFFPFLILIAVFYFLLIRPQQKKMKTHKDMLSKVDKGDTILTTGGMFGRVTNVRDDAFILEIADNVRVKISKSAIHSRQPDGAEQDK